MNIKKQLGTLLIGGSLMAFGLSMSGCSAMHTAIKKRNLDVQTKMSETIFLEPVAPKNKVIYVDIRNTSDKDVDVNLPVRTTLEARGYRITNNPDEANFMLQANVLKVGKSDLKEARSFLDAGFGGAMGAVAGASMAYAGGGGGRSAAALGLAGAAVGFIADSMVEDVMYVMVTDLQLRERPLKGEVITQTQKADLAQGSSTSVKQDISGGQVQWKSYRTRIVSTANKVNLEFAEAQPELLKGLSRSLAGTF